MPGFGSIAFHGWSSPGSAGDKPHRTVVISCSESVSRHKQFTPLFTHYNLHSAHIGHSQASKDAFGPVSGGDRIGCTQQNRWEKATPSKSHSMAGKLGSELIKYILLSLIILRAKHLYP